MNGNPGRTRVILVLSFLIFCPGLVAAEWDNSIRVCFDAADAELVPLPDGFPDSELDVLDDAGGKYKAVVLDLDNDGSPERFFPSACGKGGCDYPIYSDRHQGVIGRVFGSPICVLRKTENRMPLLQAYSGSGAGTGTIARYAFDGKRFKEIYSAATEGEEDDLVVRAILKAPFKNRGSR